MAMFTESTKRIDPGTSPIHRLAETMVSDMRRRGLSLGDRYLTAAEAGRMLGVSLTTANRAMRLLADRDVLVRSRSRGTYVGPGHEVPRETNHATIHILFYDTKRRPIRLSYNELLDGVSERVSVASLKFTRVPDEDSVHFVKNTIEADIHAGRLFGVIAGGCPRPVCRYLKDRNIPVVILGSPYAETNQIATVDLDMRQAGYLEAEYLIGHGHDRLALIAMEDWRPGDNLFLEGVQAAMAEARLTPKALVVRSTIPEKSAAIPEIRNLLERNDPPTGLICRHRGFVEAAQEAADSLNIHIPEELQLVVDASNKQHLTELDVPCCLPERGIWNIAKILGGMLCDITEGKEIEPRHVLISVVMHDTVPK